MKRIIAITIVIMLTFGVIALCAGCTSAHIAPGKTQTAISPTGEVSALAVQSQDPQAPMTQTVESDTVTVRPQESPASSPTNTVQISSHKKITTTIGASQKNTALEIAAKLASIRWLQWLGVLVALFGIASMTYPPLRLIINSVTTSAWLIGSGAAMVFLPLVIVGHEILILSVAGGVAGLWFLAHRHGSLAGELATLKSDFTTDLKPSAPPTPNLTTPLVPMKQTT